MSSVAHQYSRAVVDCVGRNDMTMRDNDLETSTIDNCAQHSTINFILADEKGILLYVIYPRNSSTSARKKTGEVSGPVGDSVSSEVDAVDQTSYPQNVEDKMIGKSALINTSRCSNQAPCNDRYRHDNYQNVHFLSLETTDAKRLLVNFPDETDRQ